jgi:long-chain acyl-CoA synthetase
LRGNLPKKGSWRKDWENGKGNSVWLSVKGRGRRPMGWSREGVVTEVIDGIELFIYKERPKSVPEMFMESVRRDPAALALVCDEVRWSFGQLAELVGRVAGCMKGGCGVKKGDRVAVVLNNCPEFVVLYLAVTSLGAVFVPLNARLKSEELLPQLLKAEPVVLIVGRDTWGEVEPIIGRVTTLRHKFMVGGSGPGVEPFEGLLESTGVGPIPAEDLEEGDLCSIIFTSGTTGKPKGVMITHRNVVNTAQACAKVFGSTSEDVDLIMVPLFHVTGLHTQLAKSLYLGSTTVLMKSFKAEKALRMIEKERVTLSISVPTIYWLMLLSPDFPKADLTSFRTIVYGGAPCPPELIVKLQKAFPHASLINAGGLTEGTSLQYALPPEDALRKAGSVGFPTPCTEARIVDESGRDVPSGEVGELILKGAGIAKGYWEDPLETARTFREGWLYTGDLARVDEEGYLWLMDRKKDMIIRGGENIYSIEVENVLYAFPKILEAAVVGIPDPIFGEQVKAFVVLKEGERATEQEIREFCSQHLADYKVPKVIEILKEPLPRNPGGKVRKDVLRSWHGPR